MLESFIRDVLLLDNPALFTTVWEAVFAIAISFVLGLMVSITYARSSKMSNTSQAFLHSLVIMTVVIAVVIIAVGSNVARAFSLAGALSIVRFRSIVHGPKDVAFIFFAMGSGLAAGTGLYLLAIVFTVVLCCLILIMSRFNYGHAGHVRTLKINLPENLAYHGLFDDVFSAHLTRHNMMSVQTVRQGTMFELIYHVVLKDLASEKDLIDSIRVINGNLSVALMLAANE